ncbi:thioesterase family protein [Vogesella sp. LIG4]|uniref:acyl-CoA thioesterase n=1 Tax=Vogesella sp. LIG4 TaxID=1192162 RepID=UPI00081FC97C|nr:thioesterase family protein [Vogesella sp. LIG4]SCK28782.1 4-hydroxybenzoyl-CoA thioesterase [Vogesella sp. LIG4]
MSELSQLPDGGRFRREVRVQFMDCDPAGIVFFPQYFCMLNGVVEQWWEQLGHPWSQLIMQRRIGTPTAHLETDFLRPSRMGDILQFELAVSHVGTRSLQLQHLISHQGEPRLRIRQRLVATSLDTHQSQPWPDDVRLALLNFKETP